MKLFYPLLILTAVLFTGCKTDKQKDSDMASADTSTAVQDTLSFEEQLEQSPRHHEWITLKSNARDLYTFVTYPEKSEGAKAVIVIHENRGLDIWARYFADQLAAKGYIVLAPDLLSNAKEGVEKTTDFETSDAAREAIYALDAVGVITDLNTVYTYAKDLPAATGKVAVAGFCWGGSQTFRYATNNPDIASAHVFYGTAPEDADALKKIKAPVYGYYGGDDNRVNSTIPRTDSIMKAAGLTYEYEIYEGAGHAFMRRGAQPDSDDANKKAHDQAWERLLKLLE